MLNEKCFKRAYELYIVIIRPIVATMRATDTKTPNMPYFARDFFKARDGALNVVDEFIKKLRASDEDGRLEVSIKRVDDFYFQMRSETA